MNTNEMTESAIRERLATLASELTKAQADLSALLDHDAGKSGDFVRLKFAVERLQAEETRLTKALPFAIQTELDKAEAEADDLAKAAAAALTAIRHEAVNQLRGAGYTSAKEDVLLHAVDHRDDVTERRNEAMKAADAAHRAAMVAARHRYR